jgi:cell division septation protein DedD
LLQNFRAAHEINPTTPRLISLGAKVVDKAKATRVRRKGFRVQIYAGSNRSEAYAIQARFKNQHADMDTYISYSEPNYRVKVGDFRSRAQANEFMNTIRSQYRSVFVFQEDIWVWE